MPIALLRSDLLFFTLLLARLQRERTLLPEGNLLRLSHCGNLGLYSFGSASF